MPRFALFILALTAGNVAIGGLALGYAALQALGLL